MRELRAARPTLSIASANTVVAKLRGTKSAAELEIIRKAVAVSMDAHREAMLAVEPGMNEFEIQALVEYMFRRNGADRPAYASIVGSGENSTTLHYNKDDRFVKAGDIIVMDVAAQYQGYAADITRSFPVSGTFTPEQRAKIRARFSGEMPGPSSVTHRHAPAPSRRTRTTTRWVAASRALRTRLSRICFTRSGSISTMVEAVAALLLVLDEHGLVVQANPAVAAATGVPIHELIGLDWAERFVPEADRAELTSAFAKTRGGRAGMALEGRVLCRRENQVEERVIRWRLAGLPGPEGFRIYASGLDVTDVRGLERRTRLAEKLAAVGTFSAGLAHEIRNPLNGATLQLQLLERQLADEQLRVDAFETQAQNAERSLAELVKRRAGLREEVERMTAALAQLGARQLAAERRVAEYRDMLSRFRKLIDAGTLDVRIARGRMVLTMPVDILFPSGSTKLSSEGSRALVEIGAVLAGIAGKKFQIEGHTDTVPIHTERFASNWELAAGRALVVTHALIDAGVGPGQLSAASFAEYEPRASNVEEAGRGLNRRIEIVVVPDLAELPGNEELQRLDAQG